MSEPEKVRLRLAPSPTGFLHIGNLRTALFGYLLAKSMHGEFILRIEDTDEKREVEGAVDSLLNVLTWLGINFDEGPHLGGDYGPYIQTRRLDIYQKEIQTLLDNRKAYRCFCTPERLTEMREEQQKNKQAPRYDRHCRNLSEDEAQAKIKAGESFVIRQAMPLDGVVEVYDELRGAIKFQAEDLDDHVLIKANGVPTYQFASVVDDHLMEISHVTRGEEWLPSFPKNILLYQAFGWILPKFIHLPLILNKTGGKLSKRQGDVFVEDYKTKGYLSEALINFCAFLGWHGKTDQEIFSLEELEKEFSIAGMGASPAVFDLEKLNYLNGYYIRQMSPENLVDLVKPYLTEAIATAPFNISDEYLTKIISLEQERLKVLGEITQATAYFFVDQSEYEAQLLVWKKSDAEKTKTNLQTLADYLAVYSGDWTKENLESSIKQLIADQGGQVGDYLWPMRVALTGRQFSPGPFEVAAVLGKEITLKRIKGAINILNLESGS